MIDPQGSERCMRSRRFWRSASAAAALVATAWLGAPSGVAWAEPDGAKASAEPSASAQPPAPAEDEAEDLVLPEGFGPVRFYDSREKVQAAFPNAKLVHDSSKETAMSSSAMPSISALEVEGEEILGLTGCRLILGFMADQLYAAEFDCGSEPAVRETLERAYGEPSLEIDDAVYWMTQATTLSMNPRSMRFAFRSRPLETSLQDAVRRAIAAGEATIKK